MDRRAAQHAAGPARPRLAAAGAVGAGAVPAGAGAGACLAVRGADGTRRLRPLHQLPCDRRAHPRRPVRADARGRHAGAWLAAARESPGRARRQEAQAQPRDPRRGHARRRRVCAAHQRARARQGGAGLSGRADEYRDGQCAAQDAGGAARGRALRARQRGRAPAAAHHPQPLPGPHHGVAGTGADARRGWLRRTLPARPQKPSCAPRAAAPKTPWRSRARAAVPRPGRSCPRRCCAAT